jgi:hypothetical protein
MVGWGSCPPVSFDLCQTITSIRLYHLMASKSLGTVILEQDRSDSERKGQLACNKNVLGTVTADAQSWNCCAWSAGLKRWNELILERCMLVSQTLVPLLAFIAVPIKRENAGSQDWNEIFQQWLSLRGVLFSMVQRTLRVGGLYITLSFLWFFLFRTRLLSLVVAGLSLSLSRQEPKKPSFSPFNLKSLRVKFFFFRFSG